MVYRLSSKGVLTKCYARSANFLFTSKKFQLRLEAPPDHPSNSVLIDHQFYDFTVVSAPKGGAMCGHYAKYHYFFWGGG